MSKKAADEGLGETERKLLASSLVTYRTRDERAALRCALGDGAVLLDKFADAVANKQRRHSYIKKRGREDAALIKRAADLLWQMREKINVDSALVAQPNPGET